jgi:hypothetical protein
MELIAEEATTTGRFSAVNAVQFIVSILRLSTGRTGCCYKTAPSHPSVLLQEEMAKQQAIILPHSPDLAQCNLFFFSCLKEKLHGCLFQSAKGIASATSEAVWDRPAKICQQYFQQLYQR